jgi:hypothetical protein
MVKTMYGAVQNYLGTVRRFLIRVIPSNKISIATLKQDVWSDLSTVYYKYEDDDQKQAFREIMSEISERLNEGKWDNVYKKLHMINQRASKLQRLV